MALSNHSERYYGNVRFPAWGIKIVARELVQKAEKDNPVYYWPGTNQQVVCLSDYDALDGIPELNGTLRRLGIPYDSTTPEFFENPEVERYCRFPDGKEEYREIMPRDRLIELCEVQSWIESGQSHSVMQQELRKRIDNASPLLPRLEDITKDTYLLYAPLLDTWTEIQTRFSTADRYPAINPRI